MGQEEQVVESNKDTRLPKPGISTNALDPNTLLPDKVETKPSSGNETNRKYTSNEELDESARRGRENARKVETKPQRKSATQKPIASALELEQLVPMQEVVRRKELPSSDEVLKNQPVSQEGTQLPKCPECKPCPVCPENPGPTNDFCRKYNLNCRLPLKYGQVTDLIPNIVEPGNWTKENTEKTTEMLHNYLVHFKVLPTHARGYINQIKEKDGSTSYELEYHYSRQIPGKPYYVLNNGRLEIVQPMVVDNVAMRFKPLTFALGDAADVAVCHSSKALRSVSNDIYFDELSNQPRPKNDDDKSLAKDPYYNDLTQRLVDQCFGAQFGVKGVDWGNFAGLSIPGQVPYHPKNVINVPNQGLAQNLADMISLINNSYIKCIVDRD